MNQGFYEKLIQIIPKQSVKLNESMMRHTTFQVGGLADYFVEVSEVSLLQQLILLIQEYGMEYFVLGNGSNLLVSDDGYRGVVIQLRQIEKRINIFETTVTVPAGTLLGSVAKEACEHALEGMEFAAGIPGTLGGAIVMNAGAYGGEMKDIVTSVRILNPQGEIITLTNEELQFGYRTSLLKRETAIVLDVILELRVGDRDTIKEKMKGFSDARKTNQPLSYPNAGSTFKRPIGHFAGKLIMDAGLSGYRIGGASVSSLHCGFIINDQKGSAKDIYDLMNYVIQVVQQKYEVTLEPEIIYLGKFE